MTITDWIWVGIDVLICVFCGYLLLTGDKDEEYKE
jgi:hypothetical protein